MLLLRGLIGLLIGSSYGVFIWKITSYTNMIGVDPAHPGPLIPDQVGMARLLAFLAGAVTGICGALSGLIVGLAGFNPRKAAWVGGGIGLLVQALLTLPFIDSSVFRAPRFFLRDLFFGLVFLPVGVGVVSVVVALVVNKIKRCANTAEYPEVAQRPEVRRELKLLLRGFAPKVRSRSSRK